MVQICILLQGQNVMHVTWAVVCRCNERPVWLMKWLAQCLHNLLLYELNVHDKVTGLDV